MRYHPDKLAPRLARAGDARHHGGSTSPSPAVAAVLERAAGVVAAAGAEWGAWRAGGGGVGARARW